MAISNIKNIMDERKSNPPVISWDELNRADFSFACSFILMLSNQDQLHATNVIRVMPKKRITVYGLWQGKKVVAKIFFNATHARKHLQKELRGFENLHKNQIPTAEVYHRDMGSDRRIYVLILKHIQRGENLYTLWQHKVSVAAMLPTLQAMMVEFATQHVLGVTQNDLHLKNFLITPKKIYTLDGAEIHCGAHLLPKKDSMNNLALFFSQFGVGLEDKAVGLFKYYAKARGWLLKKEDVSQLQEMIQEHDRNRWQSFSKKIYRNSTKFCKIEKRNTVGMINRHATNATFLDFFTAPEKLFTREENTILKAGNSTTVVKVCVEGRYYVIKRYNIKNSWHFVRRMFRPTRAFTTWRLAHKLLLFGVATPMPVAFLEKRFLGLRTVSYSILDYICGNDAEQFFSTHTTDDPDTVKLVDRITTMIKNFLALGVTHGDLKLANIIVNDNLEPVIIDLDGSVEHTTKVGLHYTFKKQIKRFLRNFDDKPYLQKVFLGKL